MLALMLFSLAIFFIGIKISDAFSPLVCTQRYKTIIAAGKNNQADYRNPFLSILGGLLEKDDQAAVFEKIDWKVPKRKSVALKDMCRLIDSVLRERQCFVTGLCDASLYSDSFAFQDPDVKVKGIESYSRGVNKLFDQKTSKMDVISVKVSTISENTITVTWRLEGKVNIGPGLGIKPYIIYTDLVVDPNENGLIVFQEDKFSIPGYDILLSALFPFLRPFLAPAALPIIE